MVLALLLGLLKKVILDYSMIFLDYPVLLLEYSATGADLEGGGCQRAMLPPPNRGIVMLHHLFNHARARTHTRVPMQTYTCTYTLCVSA